MAKLYIHSIKGKVMGVTSHRGFVSTSATPPETKEIDVSQGTLDSFIKDPSTINKDNLPEQ